MLYAKRFLRVDDFAADHRGQLQVDHMAKLAHAHAGCWATASNTDRQTASNDRSLDLASLHTQL